MSRPLRVLYTASHLGTGGIARILVRLLPRHDPGAVRPFLCYFTPSNDFAEQLGASGTATFCLGHRRTLHLPRTLFRLWRLVRELDIDLIHANHPLDQVYAGVVGRLTGIPVVRTLHNTAPVGEPEGARRLRSLSARGTPATWWARRSTTRFVTVSRAVAEAFERAGRVPRKRVEVIHSGVPLDEYSTEPSPDRLESLRREVGAGPETAILLNVGRLHEQKGQEYLIPMMELLQASHPDTILLIAGEGQERQSLERAVARAGLDSRIRFLGTRTDIPDLLTLADLFLFPSVHREGLPIATMEACCAAKPIVAARTGPLLEVVEPEVNGLLVEPRDPDGLARAVRRLLDEPETRARMGRASCRIARERFSIERSVLRLETLYGALFRP